MSEQPITREQAIAKLKKWLEPHHCLEDHRDILDFLLRELEGEKKAVEPVSYEALATCAGDRCKCLGSPFHADYRRMAAAVLRVVETQVQPFLQTRWLSRQSNDLASDILAALAQARRPT